MRRSRGGEKRTHQSTAQLQFTVGLGAESGVSEPQAWKSFSITLWGGLISEINPIK